MNYSFDLLKELEDNRNEIEAFIDSSNTAINSERINELTIIINQLLGHYSQLLVRVQDIIPKEEINISINFQKKIEKQLKALETENSQDKIKLLIEIYNSLIKYYDSLITKIHSYIKTDNTITSYNKLIIKANENIVTLNGLDLSKDIIDKISSLYNELKNNRNISKLNNFIAETSDIIRKYTIDDINDKKGTPTERVFSLFAKINDQIIESFFLPKNNLVYAMYILEDKSKYYAIIKEEKEIAILDQSFANLPNLVLTKDNIIETCKIIIKNAGIYYDINEYMRYIEKSYKTKMTKEIDELVIKYKVRLQELECSINNQLSFIDDISLLVNKMPCEKYPNIKYNDIKVEDYFPNYKEDPDSKSKEIKRLIIEVLLNPNVKSEFDTKSILKTLYDKDTIDSLVKSEYKTNTSIPLVNTDNNISSDIDLTNTLKTNSEKITTYLNNRLEELNLLSSSPKINVTITKYDDTLYKDINTILDLITAGVICDKVYKKGQGDYAILDYLKTGNNLKFTSKYKARDLATSINRDNYIKLLLENILKKYIYITSSNGKDIIIDYLTPLLTKEKVQPKDIVKDLLNNEEMLKSCIKHFDYNFLNPLSDKSLKVEKITKESQNLNINKANDMLVELKRIDNILN
mgnify:FL=1